MAFLSIYNKLSPSIRQTIVADLPELSCDSGIISNNNEEERTFNDKIRFENMKLIQSFENKLNPPKPYFSYKYRNRCTNSYSVSLLSDECFSKNLKKSGSKQELINRLLLNDLGIKQHINGRFYQKIISKGSYVDTKFIGSRYHKPIPYASEERMIHICKFPCNTDISEYWGDQGIVNLNAAQVPESIIDNNLPIDYKQLRSSKISTNTCPYLSLIWPSDQALPQNVKEFEALDTILVKYKVSVASDDDNIPDEIKYNTFEGSSDTISLFLGKKGNPVNLTGTINYHNGNVYTGSVEQVTLDYLLKNISRHSNGNLFIPSGEGKMTYSSGASYQGYWISGNKHRGKYTYPSSSNKKYYKGEFSNQKPNGNGVLVFNSGEKYEGHFVKGRFQGRGTFTCNNYTYNGCWHQNEKNGKGNIKYQDGTEYTGEWYRNMMDGYGKHSLTNGQIYEGEFYENQFQGKGKMLYSNKEIYVGDFKESLFDGTGTYTYINGNSYQGHWKMGMKSGHGKLIYSNDNYYKGEWEQDAFSGKGEFYIKKPIYHPEFKCKLKYETKELIVSGFWNDNKLICSGNALVDPNSPSFQEYPKITFSNGNSFQGLIRNMSDSKRNYSECSLTVDELSHHIEDHDNFQLINMIFCQGTFTYPDGCKFIGCLQDNSPNGEGQLILTDHSKLHGTWEKKSDNNIIPTFNSYETCNGDVFKGTFELIECRERNKVIGVNFTGSRCFEIDSKPKVETIKKDSILEVITCPITQEIMTEPMLCSVDGKTYDKKAIERWLRDNKTSPFTREPVSYDNLSKNRNIEILINLYQNN